MVLAACSAPRPVAERPTTVPQVAAAPRPALAPLEFVSFCLRNREECKPSGAPRATIAATAATMDTLAEVNSRVNARIRPSTTTRAWRINPGSGNCNDYVVSKRHELLARGFPSSALLINVVQAPSGEGHLVLVARTDQGDYVLDNLYPELRTTGEAPYQWIKRQSADDPNHWELA